MVLRKGAVALVIALSVVSVYFFVLNFNISYAKVGDEVCADFDGTEKGGEKKDDTVTKKLSADSIAEGQNRAKDEISNSKRETKDKVKVNGDGTVTIESVCGVEGTPGKVDFCYPISEGKERCLTISKEIGWSKDGTKTNVENILKEIFNAEKENVIRDAARAFKSGAKLPPEFRDLIKELGIDENTLRENINEEEAADLLRKIAAGDVEGLRSLAKSKGISLKITPEQLEKISKGIQKLVPAEAREKLADAALKACGFIGNSGGECESIVGSLIKGFTTPLSAEKTPFIPDTAETISPTGPPKISLNRYGQMSPNDLARFGVSVNQRLCAAVTSAGKTCYVTPDKWIPIIYKESTGKPQVTGDNGASKGLMQGNYKTVSSFLGSYKSIYGDDYVLHKIGDLRTVNPEFAALQSMQMGMLILQNKAESAGGNIFGSFRNYNGSGYKAQSYAIAATNMRNQLLAGRAPSYFQNIFNSTRGLLENTDASRFVKIDPNATAGFAGLPPTFASRTNSTPFASPFNVSAGGLGDLLKKFSGSSANSPSNRSSSQPAPRSTSVSQPLPPAKPPTSATPDKQTEQTSEPIRPTLSLIAYPSTAQKGDSLNIIWSAVGVSDTQKCRLNVESSEAIGTLAEGNEGTEVIQVPVTTQLTELRFTLLCVPRDTRISPEDARTSITIRLK
jgi:hypothetical protein